MSAETPNYAAHKGLDALASRYVTVADLEWTPAGCPGMDWKILFQDKERGLGGIPPPRYLCARLSASRSARWPAR